MEAAQKRGDALAEEKASEDLRTAQARPSDTKKALASAGITVATGVGVGLATGGARLVPYLAGRGAASVVSMALDETLQPLMALMAPYGASLFDLCHKEAIALR